jgi:hypothetical protein
MPNKVITPPATLSYPHLSEPKTNPQGELKYSASLIFGMGADLGQLKAAAPAVAVGRWGPKAKTMLRDGQLKWPFRDGAEKAAVGYGAGTTFVNVNSNRRPGLVSKYAGPDGKPTTIDNPDELYPGCVVRASLNAFAYDKAGSKGVSFGLNALQKLDEGERLDGRLRAEDEFEPLENEPVDLEDDDLEVDDDPMAA